MLDADGRVQRQRMHSSRHCVGAPNGVGDDCDVVLMMVRVMMLMGISARSQSP